MAEEAEEAKGRCAISKDAESHPHFSRSHVLTFSRAHDHRSLDHRSLDLKVYMIMIIMKHIDEITEMWNDPNFPFL